MDIGRTLGHYTIVSPLGRGGMGEVYVAQDAKLNRRVALKILPPEMAANAKRLERFRREAQAVAALNHPNIVTIHSVEEADGVHFITLELVEGRTLDALITAGGLGLETLFQVAIPLVDAVAAAHERGIVHRDLKPSNVMVTGEDRVKVLDFGLAKLLETGPVGDASTALADEHLTEEGKVMGTVAYMSPEQAEGKPLDHRTDVFSLGILLYEMATGTRPFTGDTRLSMMSSIVKDTPASVTELNAQLPRHLGRIIKKALEKNIGRRYQLALDLRNDLQELKEEIDSGALDVTATTISDPEALRPVGAQSSRRSWPLIVGIGSAVLLAMVAWQQGWLGGDADVVPELELTQLTASLAFDHAVTISPEGTQIAIERQLGERRTDDLTGREIFLQGLRDTQALQLTSGLGSVGGPAFSPDGTQLAFHSVQAPGGIWIMSTTGGNRRQLTTRGFNPSWSPDGSAIAFSFVRLTWTNPYSRGISQPTLGLVNIETNRVSELPVRDGIQPAWSPNGHRIAFWGSRDVLTVSVDGGAPVPVTDDPYYDYSPAWSPDGQWLFYCSTRGGSMAIWRVRIDEETGAVLDAPQQITSGGPSDPGFLSFSRDGRRLVYRELHVESRVEVADFDPVSLRVATAPTEVWSATKHLSVMEVSPNGQWLAFRAYRPQPDIFVVRADGSEAFPVTDDLAPDIDPRWSPDSRRLAFYSAAEGGYQAWVVNADGGGRIRLTDVPRGIWDPVWSPDGTEIIYSHQDGSATEIVRSNLSYEQQTPREIPGARFVFQGEQRLFWPLDWDRLTGRVLGRYGALYTPRTNEWEYLGVENPTQIARWMADGRRIIYRGGAGYYAFDTVTRQEQPVESSPGAILRLSADSRRAFLLHVSSRSNVWMLEFK